MSDSNIPSRKKQHVELVVNEDVAFQRKRTGFDDFEYEHNALPELDLADVDPTVEFLSKQLSFPLLVTGMTGGYPDAERINGALAEVAEELRVAIGSGSQRQALASTEHHSTFTILRKNAPSVPVIANIGGAEAAAMKDASDAQRLVDMLEADAFAVHTNPLQEFLQPEGTPQFRNLLSALEMLSKHLPVPVILKEVGAGISGSVAVRAFEAGVQWIDVAGAGGTSWAGVEILRRSDGYTPSPSFWDWGIPTTECLMELRELDYPECGSIASGGMRDGVDIAKALGLGAHLGGAARPFIKALEEGGQDGLRRLIENWRIDFCGVMFLTGNRSVADLRNEPLYYKPEHGTT